MNESRRVTADRPMSRIRKGNVLSSCVTPAYMNAPETVALTEKQQEVQVCENNRVRRSVGVKRVDKRRMDEVRVEVGMKDSFKKRLAMSRLIWAGMGERKLAESRCPESGGEKEVRRPKL